MSIEKQQVVNLLKAIETGETEAVSVINVNEYIQHNLAVANGVVGVLALLQLVKNSARVKTVRVFQDGNFVFAHTDYDFFGPKIGFDIFRFDNGKIVEHWDNLQTTAGPNPSGRSMVDGPTLAQNLAQTNANKALVRRFVEEIFVKRHVENLSKFLKEDVFLQHNPFFPDGSAALKTVFEAATATVGNYVEYTRVHQVFGEGDFVLVTSEGTMGSEATSFYDLFRVENGKIAEHWDTVEPIPERSQWKNDNGKF